MIEETEMEKDENDYKPTTYHSEIVSVMNCASNNELSALSVEEINGWIEIDKDLLSKKSSLMM